jgi:hypothetical protein
VSHGQDTPLIHACVDARGSLRIVAPTTNCSAKETRLTWPAEPAAPVTWYQRVSPTLLVAQGFVTALALCEAPDDVAMGGGFQLDGVPLADSASAVVTSTSCAASGLCGGTAGRDGWVVVAKSTNVAAQGIQITAYVVCATP